MNKCRVCSGDFFSEPLLKYHNVPKSAQFLPDGESLKIDKGIDMEICQCSRCGLVQLTNEPVFYFREVIRAASFSDEMKAFRKKQFESFVNEFSLKGKKVVEIGCGNGHYLEIMKQAGVDAYGLEESTESVKKCLEIGLNVSKGFIETSNYKLNNAPFDAFFIMSFLEHIPDINFFLKGIYNNLNEDGIGLVEVPNFNMILEKNLFSEFIVDHLFYFTKQTLISTLNLNGFDVLDCKEVWYNYIISAVVKKRGKLDITHFQQYQSKLQKEIEEYINQFDEKKVAIWGAGHQSLTLIALVNVSHRIKYVVDSAVFKQGKYTPTTHIPIVAPSALISDPVDAVIVMAASYSDEVARTIREKFDKNIKVSILRDFGLEIV